MSHANKVLKSINLPTEMVCVDIFMRPDGTFGFDEFRRDIEDTKGWSSIGHHDHHIFATSEAALSRATDIIGWLEDALQAE